MRHAQRHTLLHAMRTWRWNTSGRHSFAGTMAGSRSTHSSGVCSPTWAMPGVHRSSCAADALHAEQSDALSTPPRTMPLGLMQPTPRLSHSAREAATRTHSRGGRHAVYNKKATSTRNKRARSGVWLPPCCGWNGLRILTSSPRCPWDTQRRGCQAGWVSKVECTTPLVRQSWPETYRRKSLRNLRPRRGHCTHRRPPRSSGGTVVRGTYHIRLVTGMPHTHRAANTPTLSGGRNKQAVATVHERRCLRKCGTPRHGLRQRRSCAGTLHASDHQVRCSLRTDTPKPCLQHHTTGPKQITSELLHVHWRRTPTHVGCGQPWARAHCQTRNTRPTLLA